MYPSTVHWLGAGLSSGPGIIRMAKSGANLVLWNRTVEKAFAVFDGEAIPSSTVVKGFDLPQFQAELKAGDIVVSMLPAVMHPEIAELCYSKKCHLVTTSYVSDAMRSFHKKAFDLGLSFVNECGLDPGIDHVFAHMLVKEYRESAAFDEKASLDFKSYCGGIPKNPNEFKYKFSWSPAGVLRALTNRAKFVSDSFEKTADRAWEAVTEMNIFGENFEVYPNRDSVPYIKEYGFSDSWKVENFVRGTIRLSGWKAAWSEIFAQIPTASPEKIETMGNDLWKKYAYEEGEEDRVVLYVSLEAKRHGKVVWTGAYGLDESGKGRDTAMGRLVSWPATFAVEAILQGRSPLGVSAAPHEPSEMDVWMKNLKAMGVKVLKK